MKPDSSYKLPSISELLNHPTVAKVVERVNQTTIAQRTTGFLEELQSGLRSRMEHGTVPSLGQLAERLARRLLGPATQAAPTVNATGVVLGQQWPSLPLAESAVDEMMRVATEYHQADDLLSERTFHLLKEVSGAEAAWITSSYQTALHLVRAADVSEFDPVAHLGLLNPEQFGLAACETINDRLQAGARLLVIEGAGLIGGPNCGIVLGRQEEIQQVRNHPLASLLAPNTANLAALAATLDIYRSDESATLRIPVWQLLSAPLENLEQRAERVAALMSESKLLAAAEVRRCDSTWCDTPALKIAGPSWAVALRPEHGSSEQLEEVAEDASPRVVGRRHHDAYLLDLRSVFPRWDQHLVKVLQT